MQSASPPRSSSAARRAVSASFVGLFEADILTITRRPISSAIRLDTENHRAPPFVRLNCAGPRDLNTPCSAAHVKQRRAGRDLSAARPFDLASAGGPREKPAHAAYQRPHLSAWRAPPDRQRLGRAGVRRACRACGAQRRRQDHALPPDPRRAFARKRRGDHTQRRARRQRRAGSPGRRGKPDRLRALRRY